MKKNNLFVILLGLVLTFTSCGGPENTGETSDGVGENEHRIFVTSIKYNGNLSGLTGADSKCMLQAQSAGLTKTYKAVLSDETDRASERLTITGAIYRFKSSTESELVATGSSSFWSTDTTNLLNTVSYDETYSSLSSGELVWTGTDSDGNITTGDTCSDWGSSSSGTTGFVGRVGSSNDAWIENTNLNCNQTYRLYCISQ